MLLWLIIAGHWIADIGDAEYSSDIFILGKRTATIHTGQQEYVGETDVALSSHLCMCAVHGVENLLLLLCVLCVGSSRV